ncbi:hypothetical protein, conserved [Eimeria necatrix]|uniref:U1-type domain-containing protein n=1 Tax=Eimeria necatrix TaxID=51315 RepID=U6MZF7_9EIME|nr:hypothetical protein, conserved [Eimeria necatrix]CDJ67045.1 hypothetical protein, conserved [Eimeria necatrix]
MMMPPPPHMGVQQQQQQQGAGGSAGSSSGAPDLLSTLKPCALPEDMPLPVSSRKAAAAAAAAADNDEDDTGGFDWRGLAQQTQQHQEPKQQQHSNASEAVAAASQRIALITGNAAATAAAAAGAAVAAAATAATEAARQKNGAERAGPQDGTDALGRRVWDKEYYSEKAREKALTGVDAILELLPKPKEKPKAPPLPPCGYRQQLQQRTFKLDFEREVGRTKMVTLQTPRMQQGGFWCDICECLCKDSQAYLDHINGRNHNRLLGMSMRVERVPLAKVKAKLQALRQSQGTAAEPAEKTKAESGPVKIGGAPYGAEGGAPEAEDEFDRVKRRIEELQREQELKKQRKKERKKAAAAAAAAGGGSSSTVGTVKAAVKSAAADETVSNPDAAALAAMGLPTSFAGC